MSKTYEDSGVYKYGVALVELGKMFMDGNASLADITSASRELGLKMEFRISPIQIEEETSEVSEMQQADPQGQA